MFDVGNEHKRALLQQLGLLALATNATPEDLLGWTVDGLLQAARVHCLSKIELYFLQDARQLRQSLNCRNEAAAVSLLLAYLGEGYGTSSGREESSSSRGSRCGSHRAELLGALVDYSRTLWQELESGDVMICSISTSPGEAANGATCGQQDRRLPLPRGVPAPPGSTAADFEGWAAEQGVQAAIGIARFGALRGCAALREVAPGEKLLSIPAEVLIYEDTVRQTDLGRMLMAIPNLTIDNLLIIFTLIDRHDEDSKWARYWRSLPDKYYTGLSFPRALVGQLAGTAAHLELLRAQAHLRQQYADTRPLFDMLLAAYPQYLQPAWFDYESYLWAAELWYSYAFEVEFPEKEQKAAGSSGKAKGSSSSSSGKAKGSKAKGSRKGTAPKSASAAAAGSRSSIHDGGSSKPVMVPFACHVNHSPWPHCVRYGKLNPRTRTLDYPAFRPCQQGQQVFISYGPVPNMKLLCYYGFAVPCNPHDLVPLLLEPPEGPLHAQQLAALEALGLGLEHNLQDGSLSKQLLACLRVIVCTAEELAQVAKRRKDPLSGPLNPDNEEQALATLRAALEGMLATLEALPLLASAEGAWVDAAAAQAADQLGQTHLEQQEQEGAPLAAATQRQQEQQDGGCEPAARQAASGDSDAGEQQQQPAQADAQPAACNENGLDADWHMSRQFCRIYLEGQLAILRRSLAECAALMKA